MDRMKQFKTVQEEALDLFSKKNADVLWPPGTL